MHEITCYTMKKNISDIKTRFTFDGGIKRINVFFVEIAEAFLFVLSILKETFSRDFEYKEFFRQCFQIGYKTLPLISITGIIIGFVIKWIAFFGHCASSTAMVVMFTIFLW